MVLVEWREQCICNRSFCTLCLYKILKNSFTSFLNAVFTSTLKLNASKIIGKKWLPITIYLVIGKIKIRTIELIYSSVTKAITFYNIDVSSISGMHYKQLGWCFALIVVSADSDKNENSLTLPYVAVLDNPPIELLWAHIFWYLQVY